MPKFRLGRVAVVVFGGVPLAGAALYLAGALVNKEWITAGEGRWVFGAIAAVYSSYSAGFVVMVAAGFALLVLHERAWLTLLKEKNKEIDRLVEQRNRLENIILGERGSSDPSGGKRPKK